MCVVLGVKGLGGGWEGVVVEGRCRMVGREKDTGGNWKDIWRGRRRRNDVIAIVGLENDWRWRRRRTGRLKASEVLNKDEERRREGNAEEARAGEEALGGGGIGGTWNRRAD